MLRPLFLAITLTGPASAGINEVIDAHILPGTAQFATETAALAQVPCDAAQLKLAYHASFDAWLAISHLQFGPIESEGRALSVAFWPDPKGQAGKSLGRLIAAQDLAVQDPAQFAEVSIAAQGFFALERLLFEIGLEDAYSCDLARAITTHLAGVAAEIDADWRNSHAELLRHPGAENETYTSDEEVKRVIFTALSSGLEFLETQRLGRPLGGFDRPRPTRAEARRSARSQRNIVLSLMALKDLTSHFADSDLPATDAAFVSALHRAETLEDVDLSGVSDPSRRLRVEALQQMIGQIRVAIASEIGEDLGIRAGFNSLDGD